MPDRLDVLLTSRRGPAGVGGLAAYQRFLAEQLLGGGKSVAFFSEENTRADGLPAPLFFGRPVSAGLRAVWMRLASRPAFHPVLEAWVGRRMLPRPGAWRESAPDGKNRMGRMPTPRAVHFVGTGWDFVGFAMLRLARRSRARFTVWPAVHPGQWGDDRIDLRLYRQADAVFCQSRHEAAHLTSLGLDPARILVCGLPPMCLPGRSARALRESLAVGDRPAVLFLGRRDASKGYPALLEAWRIVLATVPEAVLLVSGPGGEEFQPQLDALPPGSIRDLGIADEETKALALAACDVFCLPSTQESFGIVYAEAWSYGKPVVCGPAPAPSEWIEDGVSGLHVGQSPAEIASALTALLRDPARASAMGEAGRQFQQSRLTAKTTLASHLRGFGM